MWQHPQQIASTFIDVLHLKVLDVLISIQNGQYTLFNSHAWYITEWTILTFIYSLFFSHNFDTNLTHKTPHCKGILK